MGFWEGRGAFHEPCRWLYHLLLYITCILCPISTFVHPMSQHNFDHAHSTKLFSTKIGMCPPGPHPTPFPFFLSENMKNWESAVFQVVKHCHTCPAKLCDNQ